MTEQQRQSTWDDYVDFYEHNYITGIQCDQSHCYACATQRYNCKRLDLLDSISKIGEQVK